MKKQKKIKQKGITLIALIITIIVMLILVGVSVSVALNGGLFKTAKQAAEKTKLAVQKESSLKYEYEIAKATGEYTRTYKEYLLQKEYEEKKASGEIEESKTFKEYVLDKYSLGDPIKAENYGKKVIGYKSKGEGLDTLVWRVFYQDNKNVYLISETEDGQLPVIYDDVDLGDYQDYSSGSDVSVFGQCLMPLGYENNLFSPRNSTKQIKLTAQMCDPDLWDAYTDAEGKASYAIGSPTIDLFAASYNASNLGHTINLSIVSERNDTSLFHTFDALGYDYSCGDEWFSAEDKNGIYNLNWTSHWSLSSPRWESFWNLLSIREEEGKFWWFNGSNGDGCRPIVCIPVESFSSYTLSNEIRVTPEGEFNHKDY